MHVLLALVKIVAPATGSQVERLAAHALMAFQALIAKQMPVLLESVKIVEPATVCPWDHTTALVRTAIPVPIAKSVISYSYFIHF